MELKSKRMRLRKIRAKGLNNTKEERREYVNLLLEQEIETLRKKLYPWQRIALLEYPVEIRLDDSLEAKEVAGMWDFDKTNNKHIIIISTDILEQELKRGNKQLTTYERLFGQRVVDIIKHELIHGFVYENFEWCSEAKHTMADSSFIFLSVLYFVNGKTAHYIRYNFYETELYKDIKADKFKNYKQLQAYLMKEIFKINRISEKMKTNEFASKYKSLVALRFGDENAGLVKCYKKEFKNLVGKLGEKKLKTTKITNYIFSIGCNVLVDDLERLIIRKINYSRDFLEDEISSNYYLIDNVGAITLEKKINKKLK